jgi:enoyl-CoA hydratase/carnithine racemase
VQTIQTGKALTATWLDRGIALATLTRGDEMNTLTLDLIRELSALLDRLVREGTRALIVTGSGRAFCCGAHLRYFAGPDATVTDPFSARDGYLAEIAETYDRLEEMPFPTIAAVNGFALGGGFELALSCDLRVFAKAAKVGLPETRIGAVAGAGGVQKLIRHVGRSKALEWILTGAHVDADEAARFGLAVDVVPAAEVVNRALELARVLRRLGPRAIAQSKRSIYVAEDTDLRSARRFGIEALSMLVGGDEWKEGMQAFLEKRPPAFDGW